jgi:Zn-dependent protease with chaperone function
VPFEFRATGAEYLRIWIVNLLLTIVTVGIYSAWAKVRRLRYFYGSTALDGASFEYHGKPLAILKGRLITVGVSALLQAKHSRDFEREADAFAKRWMATQGIAAHRFDDILCRMEAEMGGSSDDALSKYLSTHPATDERARCALAHHLLRHAEDVVQRIAVAIQIQH